MDTFNAQEYLEKNHSDRSLTKIFISSSSHLNGDLLIQDYSDLVEIDIHNNGLTSLNISNCPLLKQINVRNNGLTKLDLEKVKINEENQPVNNEISEIIAGGNELTILDLTYCSKLKKLIAPDNPYLTKLEKLNLALINSINIANTSVSLTGDYENLKQENDNLYEILKGIKETGQEKKLVLTEAIKTSKQAEEAIKRHLKKTEKEWREYFESEEKGSEKKNSLLNLAFQSPELRWKGKAILTWIIEAQVSGDYWTLVKKWNERKDYNSIYDFDGSLYTLLQYLGIRDYINQNNLEQYDR